MRGRLRRAPPEPIIGARPMTEATLPPGAAPAAIPGDRSRRRARWAAAAVCGVLAALLLGQGVRVASLPPVQIVSWNVIIDDGFYYLQVARNLARGHGSTFDRVNHTNGYQPLWALALVPIFWLTDDTAAGIRATLILSALLGALALGLFYLGVQRLVGLGAALLLGGLVALNPYFLHILQGGLETPALLLGLAALVALWALRAEEILDGRRRPCLLLGALLGLTVLARVDVALILAPLGAVVLLWGPGTVRARLRRALYVVAPAALLLLPFIAWSWFTEGTTLPVSGLVKRWVAATYTPTRELFVVTEQWRGLARTLSLLQWPRQPPPETIEAILPLLRLPGLLVGVLAARLIWSRRARRNRAAQLLLAATVIGVAAHGLYMFYIYRSCGHWNYHYFFPYALLHTALLAVTPALLLADLGLLLDRLLRSRLRPFFAALGVVVSLPALGYLGHQGLAAAQVRLRELSKPPEQSFRKSRWDAAAEIRRRYPPQEVLGSWWAGTVGYLSDRRIVNLDGVINSRAFYRGYLRTDTVHRYVLEGPVAHLVDFFWHDPLVGPPAWRAFWWEHDKETIVQRLRDHLRLARMIPFRADQGMYLYDVIKR
jgi:4-amino-4-deoxy-L-arabinose transferase-like glycosyltransferase